MSTAAWDDDPAERLRRRYPAPRVRRRTKALLVGLGTLIALGWLIWTALAHARPAVTAQVASYTVLSDTAMTVTVTVERRDPSVPARCRLLAQSTDFQPVAEQDIAVPASQVKLANIEVKLTTLRRATSATVRSCTTA